MTNVTESSSLFFFFNDTPTTEIYTLSLHDALPISTAGTRRRSVCSSRSACARRPWRSEEHTSELQSRENLVCRLLLEKKKKFYSCLSLNSPPLLLLHFQILVITVLPTVLSTVLQHA